MTGVVEIEPRIQCCQSGVVRAPGKLRRRVQGTKRNGKTVAPTSPCAPLAHPYLSKLRRDSVGADFQSVRKLTNYVCVAPPVSRLSVFRKGS